MSLPVTYGRLVGALDNQGNKIFVDIPLVADSPVESRFLTRTITMFLNDGLNQLNLGPILSDAALKLAYRCIVCFPDDFPADFVNFYGNTFTDIGLKIPTKGGATMIFTYDPAAGGYGNFVIYFSVSLPDGPIQTPIEIYVF